MMNRFNNGMVLDDLVGLVVRVLSGTASPEERQDLEKWMDEKPEHRELFDRLSHGNTVPEEYSKWKLIDTQGPMSDMERRINSLKDRRRFPYAAAISILSVAAAVAVVVLYPRNAREQQPAAPVQNYIETIIPGHTMATLTQPDGKTYNLINEDVPVKPAEVKKPVAKSAPKSEDLVALSMNSLKVPRGGEFHIILEDSTEVWLNAESSLTYPESFSDKERLVEVSGEAFFNVKKDNGRPFYVKSAGQIVRVYGTEFGISSYPDDANVYTTLVSGKIGILPDINSSSVLYLAPDHQAIYSKGDATTVVNSVNAKLLTSWKDGLFVFEDQSLDQIMVQLSRWYDFEYRFADESVAGIMFKGRIPRYGKFGDLLEILEKSGGIRFEAEDRCIIISRQN